MNVSLSKVVALTALSFSAQALSYDQGFLDFRLPDQLYQFNVFKSGQNRDGKY